MSTSRRIVKSILRCHRQWRRRRRRSYFMKERIYLFYSLTTFREATDQMKRFSANIGQLIFFFALLYFSFSYFHVALFLSIQPTWRHSCAFTIFMMVSTKSVNRLACFFSFWYSSVFLPFIHYDSEAEMTIFFGKINVLSLFSSCSGFLYMSVWIFQVSLKLSILNTVIYST